MLKKTLCALAMLGLTLPAVAGELPVYPFIHANGTANVMIMPDIGEIDLDILSTDADPETAWKVVETRMADLKALYESLELDPAGIEMQNIRRRTRRTNNPAEGIPETLCSVHLTVKDMQKWDALVAGILKLSNIEGFGLSFSRSDRKKIETELMAEAIAEAKQKADDMARGLGKQIGGVGGISPQPIKNLSHAFGLSTSFEAQRGVTESRQQKLPVYLAPMKLSLSVDVLYKIK